jgi:hypothetical protein
LNYTSDSPSSSPSKLSLLPKDGTFTLSGFVTNPDLPSKLAGDLPDLRKSLWNFIDR